MTSPIGTVFRTLPGDAEDMTYNGSLQGGSSRFSAIAHATRWRAHLRAWRRTLGYFRSRSRRNAARDLLLRVPRARRHTRHPLLPCAARRAARAGSVRVRVCQGRRDLRRIEGRAGSGAAQELGYRHPVSVTLTRSSAGADPPDRVCAARVSGPEILVRRWVPLLAVVVAAVDAPPQVSAAQPALAPSPYASPATADRASYPFDTPTALAPDPYSGSPVLEQRANSLGRRHVSPRASRPRNVTQHAALLPSPYEPPRELEPSPYEHTLAAQLAPSPYGFARPNQLAPSPYDAELPGLAR